MHLPIRGQTAPPQGGKGINSIKKIVQICALLCTIVQTFSKKNPAEAGFFITAIFKQFSSDTQTLKLHSQSSHMTQKPKCHH
ncbi:hypothetical protein D4616_10630 [Escherichia coli]|nr:hypothetical protein [Escherichia coli]EEW2103961.1 hypothetical protein [Escherichia coli]EEW8392280.1 hypothetical protein [Escherichia coli]EEW9199937.1 hypothetical protein [Escherichia coli]EGD5976704.1 hypothetical protein [Escherichia coli]